MVQPVLFSSERERWSEIRDFPKYSVSDLGRVMNNESGQILTPSRKPEGLLMVGLMEMCPQRGRPVQYKRSLPLLVAQAFIPPPSNVFEAFDTPIHLDGDRANNHITNLMWRPLWFARKYMRQLDEFRSNGPCVDSPIEDIETGERYEHSMHAASVNGLLDREIYVSMHENTYVWPTGQVFRHAIS